MISMSPKVPSSTNVAELLELAKALGARRSTTALLEEINTKLQEAQAAVKSASEVSQQAAKDLEAGQALEVSVSRREQDVSLAQRRAVELRLTIVTREKTLEKESGLLSLAKSKFEAEKSQVYVRVVAREQIAQERHWLADKKLAEAEELKIKYGEKVRKITAAAQE